MEDEEDGHMDRETVELFLNKFVALEKRSYREKQSFNLYGIITKVTDDSVTIETDRLGAVSLDEIISIRETEKKTR